MRRVARLYSCAACKRGGAVKRADGYGRVLRLTIEFRYFECGRNTETPPGRSCLSFGNLQVINRDAHAAKSALEARARSAAHSLETELT